MTLANILFLALICIPLTYLITRPDDAIAVEDWDIVPGTTAPPGITDHRIEEIERLANFKDMVAIADEVYPNMKAQVLG